MISHKVLKKSNRCNFLFSNSPSGLPSYLIGCVMVPVGSRSNSFAFRRERGLAPDWTVGLEEVGQYSDVGSDTGACIWIPTTQEDLRTFDLKTQVPADVNVGSQVDVCAVPKQANDCEVPWTTVSCRGQSCSEGKFSHFSPVSRLPSSEQFVGPKGADFIIKIFTIQVDADLASIKKETVH